MESNTPPVVKKPGFTISEILGINTEDDLSSPGLPLSSSPLPATMNFTISKILKNQEKLESSSASSSNSELPSSLPSVAPSASDSKKPRLTFSQILGDQGINHEKSPALPAPAEQAKESDNLSKYKYGDKLIDFQTKDFKDDKKSQTNESKDHSKSPNFQLLDAIAKNWFNHFCTLPAFEINKILTSDQANFTPNSIFPTSLNMLLMLNGLRSLTEDYSSIFSDLVAKQTKMKNGPLGWISEVNPAAEKFSAPVEINSTWFNVGERYESMGLPNWTPENAVAYRKLYDQHVDRRSVLMKFKQKPSVLIEGTPEYKERYQAAVENAKITAARWDKNVSRCSLFDPNRKKAQIPQFVRHPANSYNHYRHYRYRIGMRMDTCAPDWDAMCKAQGAEYWKWCKIASDIADEHMKQLELGFITVAPPGSLALKRKKASMERAARIKKQQG